MKKWSVFIILFLMCTALPASAQAGSDSAPPYGSPEYKAIGEQVQLIGSFLDQLEYFRVYYGRVPFSYEEWRDSGFLLFTPWTGISNFPAKHVDRTPSVETDSYGTFHYQYIGPSKYKLELLSFVSEGLEVLTYESDLSAPLSFHTGLSYMEAKADAYANLLFLLWCHNYDYLLREPTSLLDAAESYVSLVSAGFKLPEGVAAEGKFEMGIDLSTDIMYFLSDLDSSLFSSIDPVMLTYGDIDNPPDTISDNRLVLFSSDKLQAGYPELYGK